MTITLKMVLARFTRHHETTLCRGVLATAVERERGWSAAFTRLIASYVHLSGFGGGNGR